MDILIIGGTKFLGRAYAEEIVKQGHNLTFFNRGKTDPDFMPEVTDRIVGDRETDLDKLGDRSWDVVIDPSGYVPRVVQLSVEALKKRVKYYVYISSVSVYVDTEEFGIDESAEIATIEDETVEEITGETYGALKFLCEQEVTKVFGDQAIIIRPGLIVGPYDPTNRFTYWLTRVRKGGKILSPGDGSMPCQYVDARDIALFTMKLLKDGNTGTFNVTGPVKPIPIKDLLEETKHVTGSDAEFMWASDEWLVEQEVGPWMELPLWIPSVAGAAMMSVSIDAAVNVGLEFRSNEEIIRDTLEWYDRINGDDQQWAAGLDSAKESKLIETLQNN